MRNIQARFSQAGLIFIASLENQGMRKLLVKAISA